MNLIVTGKCPKQTMLKFHSFTAEHITSKAHKECHTSFNTYKYTEGCAAQFYGTILLCIVTLSFYFNFSGKITRKPDCTFNFRNEDSMYMHKIPSIFVAV
jgi:hypothetical protein